MRLPSWLLGRFRKRKGRTPSPRRKRRAVLGIESLESRTVPDAAGFLNKAYLDLLGRSAAADPGTSSFLTALTLGGADRTQVALAIERSPEFTTAEVQGLF